MLIDVFRNFCFLFNKDIDECTDATSGCQQICTNSPGSFSCSCVVGHTLKSDNKTCEAPGNLTLKYVTSSQFCWFKRLKFCCFNICEVKKKSQSSLTLKKPPKKNAKKKKYRARDKRELKNTFPWLWKTKFLQTVLVSSLVFLSVTDICAAAGLSCGYTCDNSTGTFVCVCPSGYELEANQENCTGINPTHYAIRTI